MDGESEIHALEPEDFRSQVLSFDHWFDTVQGYLRSTHHGHADGLQEESIDDADRERLINVLCTYAVGEEAALDASSALARLAPNRACKIFLATQAVDEARHLEAILHRMREVGVTDPDSEIRKRAHPTILEFARRLVQLVDDREWEAGVFMQNVVLESMEFATFRVHAESADPVTRDLLERIIRDERRHIGFGESELGPLLAGKASLRGRLRVLRGELDPLVLKTFESATSDLGVPADQRQRLGCDYLRAVERMGVS
jgi:1,2-phenylacetyl-CoA epoxidase catalytic subunit